MIFEIDFTLEALEDIEKLKKTGNKLILKKLFSLIQELKQHPETGTGKPERLKHYQQNTWSRRIDRNQALSKEMLLGIYHPCEDSMWPLKSNYKHMKTQTCISD
jgi:toxin YoeB